MSSQKVLFVFTLLLNKLEGLFIIFATVQRLTFKKAFQPFFYNLGVKKKMIDLFCDHKM